MKFALKSAVLASLLMATGLTASAQQASGKVAIVDVRSVVEDECLRINFRLMNTCTGP